MAEHLGTLIDSVDKIVEHLKKPENNQSPGRRAWLIHVLGALILHSHNLDVWDTLYKSRYSFASKHSDQQTSRHRESFSEETNPDQTDAGGIEPPTNSKTERTKVVRTGRAPGDPRGYKDFKSSAMRLLLYPDVEKELGEEPAGVNRGARKLQRSSDKVDVFHLTFLKFMPAPEEILDLRLRDSSKPTKRQYQWKGRPYLIGLKHAIVLLCDYPMLQGELTAHLQQLYMTYVHCAPSNNETAFFMEQRRKGGSRNLIGWFEYDENGNLLNMNQSEAASKGPIKLREFRKKNFDKSGWNQEWGKLRIDEDWAWGMTGKRAIDEGVITEAVRIASKVEGVNGMVSFYRKPH